MSREIDLGMVMGPQGPQGPKGDPGIDGTVDNIEVVDTFNLLGYGTNYKCSLQAFLDTVSKKKASVDLHKQREIFIPAYGWTSSYPYTNTVYVSGITSDMNIKVVGVKHAIGNTVEEDNAIDKAVSCLMSNENGVGNGVITFTAKKKPTTSITVITEGG